MARYTGNPQTVQYTPKGVEHYLQKYVLQANTAAALKKKADTLEFNTLGVHEKDLDNAQKMIGSVQTSRDSIIEKMMGGEAPSMNDIRIVNKHIKNKHTIDQSLQHSVNENKKYQNDVARWNAYGMQTGRMGYASDAISAINSGFNGAIGDDGSLTQYTSPKIAGYKDIRSDLRRDLGVAAQDMRDKGVSEAEIDKALQAMSDPARTVVVPGTGKTITPYEVPEGSSNNFNAIASVAQKYKNKLKGHDSEYEEYLNFRGDEERGTIYSDISRIAGDYRRQRATAGNLRFLEGKDTSGNVVPITPKSFNLGAPQVDKYGGTQVPQTVNTVGADGATKYTINSPNPETLAKDNRKGSGRLINPYTEEQSVAPVAANSGIVASYDKEKYVEANNKTSKEVFGKPIEEVSIEHLESYLKPGNTALKGDAFYESLHGDILALRKYGTKIAELKNLKISNIVPSKDDFEIEGATPFGLGQSMTSWHKYAPGSYSVKDKKEEIFDFAVDKYNKSITHNPDFKNPIIFRDIETHMPGVTTSGDFKDINSTSLYTQKLSSNLGNSTIVKLTLNEKNNWIPQKSTKEGDDDERNTDLIDEVREIKTMPRLVDNISTGMLEQIGVKGSDGNYEDLLVYDTDDKTRYVVTNSTDIRNPRTVAYVKDDKGEYIESDTTTTINNIEPGGSSEVVLNTSKGTAITVNVSRVGGKYIYDIPAESLVAIGIEPTEFKDSESYKAMGLNTLINKTDVRNALDNLSMLEF